MLITQDLLKVSQTHLEAPCSCYMLKVPNDRKGRVPRRLIPDRFHPGNLRGESKSYFFILPLPGERRNAKSICGGGKLLPACLPLCENNRPFRPGHCGGRVLGKYMRKKESR